MNSTHSAEMLENYIYIYIYYIYTNYINCTMYLLMECIYVAFPEAPPTPPSLSRHLESEERHELPLCQQAKEFIYSLWLFFKNAPFMVLLLATGMMWVWLSSSTDSRWSCVVCVQEFTSELLVWSELFSMNWCSHTSQ